MEPDLRHFIDNWNVDEVNEDQVVSELEVINDFCYKTAPSEWEVGNFFILIKAESSGMRRFSSRLQIIQVFRLIGSRL